MKFQFFLIFSLLLFFNEIIAQATVSDTLELDIIKEHSPKKATLLSTAMPGLGQAYNKKYWKIPIVYGAIGTSLYFAFSNNKEYKRFKTAYGLRLDGDDLTVDDFPNLSDASLESNLDFYQRNRDLSFIFAGLFYVLNIVDAAVDAHLFSFPKNDNLSFNLQPSMQLTQNNRLFNGLSLVIKL